MELSSPSELSRLTSLETQLARLAYLRCADRVRCVGRRGVVHLRSPPLLLNSLVRLPPGRKFLASLRPVNQSSFVTPVKNASHGRPVGFRAHECLHRILGRPSRASPKRVPAVPQQFDCEVPLGSRSLPSNPQRLDGPASLAPGCLIPRRYWFSSVSSAWLCHWSSGIQTASSPTLQPDRDLFLHTSNW